MNTRLRRAMRELSKALVDPIRSLLKSSTHRHRHICFIPAGHLTRVPFAALELDGRPLIEDFVVYQAPSLVILKLLSESTNRKPPGLSSIAVVVANDLSLPANVVECVDTADQLGAILSQHDAVHVGARGEMVYKTPLSSFIELKEPCLLTCILGSLATPGTASPTFTSRLLLCWWDTRLCCN
ncbi:hypothetical protein B0T26DRAFT_695671 [Lasiosphaeria miniovina]|uniref:CHAT domain-containing protein n=1 Tax=Lasiosphaeria miniovina TaxID=1954250 RepID=A0AA40B541_9PEZI|nr:uncharacterized protein B0T26DRAFT_695671 [Lasiosphaeria miniovina]KAK0727768.1 hypothetical protein B0T26DRAFT_695671 [Lasiosphaeria miniovina]